MSEAELLGKQVQDKGLVNLTHVMVVKNSGSDSLSSPTGTIKKGKGLRKWRRIKREVTKEGGVIFDGSKLSKRGAQGKLIQLLSEMRQSSEGFISSTHSIVQILVSSVDGFEVVGDSGPTLGHFLATASELENSNDRISKSSTTATIANMRYGSQVVAGHVNDREKITNMNGKSFGSTVQKVPQGKAQREISKKSQGEQVNVEKETSHSSMESDSRSSNRQNGGSMSFGGENSFKTFSNGSSWSVKEDNSETQVCSTNQDVLTESSHMLQFVQETIEKEIQKFREIGKEDGLVNDLRQDSCLPSDLMSGGDYNFRSLHTLESDEVS